MSKELPRWAVSLIRGSRAEHLTIVNAKDAASAIAAVVKDHKITDPHQMKRRPDRLFIERHKPRPIRKIIDRRILPDAVKAFAERSRACGACRRHQGERPARSHHARARYEHP
jgi:hypothetical protein